MARLQRCALIVHTLPAHSLHADLPNLHSSSAHLHARAQVDLPGIIHAMESGTNGPDYPALVKGMARDYISRPASIIVAVVTCKEDLDTQVQGGEEGNNRNGALATGY
eukprot:1146042-Pelagomonas_calceolata.AAC.6